MVVKPPTTRKQQIEIMRERGLRFVDEEKALAVLDTLNYYVLSGYLFRFKDASGRYPDGLTFERIYSLFKFDNVLRNILLFAIERIERVLKAKISTAMVTVHPDDPCIYESADFFKDKPAHIRFMKSFKAEIKRNENVPFVKHHIKKYNRHFPIWVAVELFTLGNIKHLYQNLPGKLRKDISATFDVSPRVLDSWIENLRVTRNSLAHNMRVYGAKYMNTPKMPKGAYKPEAAQHRIFDQVYLMMLLYPEESEWNDIVDNLDALIETYRADIELHAIGFPDDWKEHVIKKGFPAPWKDSA